MTEASDMLRGRRVVVVTSSLTRGYNALWDAVEPDVAALAVVGARPPDDDLEVAPPDTRIPLRSVDLGRGLVYEHLFGLRRFLRGFRPDVVHVNRELWTVVAQEVVSSGAAVVIHGAENLWHHGGRVEQVLRDRLVARAVRRIDGYASWNHAGADHVSELRGRLRLPPIPTLVLPGVIPPSAYHDTEWKPPGDSDPLEVLLVGRATPEKGFQDVIDAVARLRDVRITLCGQGPMLEELVGRARDRRVALEAVGFVTAEELAERMARSHLMVQPSLSTPGWAEQFGRTVAEAMTVGLPCLVSDSGELPFLVGHDSRALFREGDITDLRDRIAALTGPEQRDELSRHQRSLAAAWRTDVAGAAVLDLWRRMLA
ncbi:glycosyltransferase family 4 protein [Nocardioides sp.]|uniref:glycosyltransferase family 4 protein n=1 Tax=Nocardioides sp. TaxID=35761 RepID=UPI002F3E4429